MLKHLLSGIEECCLCRKHCRLCLSAEWLVGSVVKACTAGAGGNLARPSGPESGAGLQLSIYLMQRNLRYTIFVVAMGVVSKTENITGRSAVFSCS